jgi:hypothetical protein
VTPVRIGEVALGSEHDSVLARGVDTPKSGQEFPFYGFDLRGWAIGRHVPARTLVARHGAGSLRRVMVDIERPDVAAEHPEPDWADRSGYFLPVGALRLDPEFEVDFGVELEGGTRAPLGRITGSRARLETSFQGGLEPIGLTALGRTGSTAVTRLLASHPSVVAYRPFEYEPRVATYWIDILKALSEPASFRRQIAPNGPLVDAWWAGTGAPFPRRLVDEQVQGWLGGESIEELAVFCQTRIDGLYGLAAKQAERPSATHFVEKLGPETGALLRELYPRAREVFLVRDFRDVVASIFAFNEKRGFQGFGRGRAASDVEYVSEWISESVSAFLAAWRTRSSGAHLVRYEELVREPRETLAAALGYLELDADGATIGAMLETLDKPESDIHRTTEAEASIGRWQRDLAGDVREACERSLGEALGEFGYTA